MDSEETKGHEHLFPLRNGLCGQEASRRGEDIRIAARALEVEDVLHRNNLIPVRDRDYQTPQCLLLEVVQQDLEPLLLPVALMPYPLEGAPQLLRINGLEEVIHGTETQRLNRIAVVRRHKNHGKFPLWERLQELKPVLLRHLDIEEEDIRAHLPHHLPRFGCRTRNTLHSNKVGTSLLDQLPEYLKRRRLVVYQHCPEHRHSSPGDRRLPDKDTALHRIPKD